jgi:glycosyltransferase involved in cell wall biosynthesis
MSPNAAHPLVSITTPARNEAQFLAECIESVLAQTYQNWDYTIVDNCSSDETLAIAQQYAAKDARIRVICNDKLLPIIQNHNHAIRQISPDSKYCKFVFADDWLYPTCIEEMVRVAEQTPSVGLVGAYTTDGQTVMWPGPPYPANCISGKEICRSMLLGGPFFVGTMTSVLVRSDLIRKRPVFFNEANLHADTQAFYDLLYESDYSYVHQVLSFNRLRPQSNTSFADDFNSIELGNFVIFLKYGPLLLDAEEYGKRIREARREYHRVLAHNLFRIRSDNFWEYHKRALKAFGAEIDWWLVAKQAASDFCTHAMHPFKAARRGKEWWTRAWNGRFGDKRSPNPQRRESRA